MRPLGTAPSASDPAAIVLDCDPGHDDAMALLLAHGSPAIDLLAVTTVAGNQTLEKVTRNAQSVAATGGFGHVPIAAGADRPLVRPPQHAEGIHGSTGMDGPALAAPTAALDPRHAVQLIIDTVMSRDSGTVTLVATAAHTNLALAARLEPRIVPRVREVVFMGGAVHGGNWSATAEFNVIVDPEAARVVVGEAWPVTMVGLDVTHQALATTAVREAVAAVGTRPAAFVGELLDFFGAAYRREQGFSAPPVHDPVAVAAVIDPAVLGVRAAPLDVVVGDGPTLGMTVADLRRPTPPGCTTRVALSIDVDRFWTLFVDALRRIGDPG